METGRRTDCGVCAAVGVHYLSTGGARAAAIVAAGAAFSQVLAERVAVVPQVPPYRPGKFYLRELPPLREVLGALSGLSLAWPDGIGCPTRCAVPPRSRGRVCPQPH